MAEGADRSDRSLADVELLASPLVVSGATASAREKNRERIRRRIAFYGSTRTYHPALEVHGWERIGRTLHDLSLEYATEYMQ